MISSFQTLSGIVWHRYTTQQPEKYMQAEQELQAEQATIDHNNQRRPYPGCAWACGLHLALDTYAHTYLYSPTSISGALLTATSQ